MSQELAIKADNISKIYKLYEKPVDRLIEALHPLRKQYHTPFAALTDISFEVQKGEALGIVGKNGSGKSTLLKILTGVLTPSSGDVAVNGKVSALLELGAGFNPDMTGIENIYLNGVIMGYSRKEMEAKLDDILAFADIGDFVNQPVKSYSSGMFVRLAFALQVQVNPDILIVDEALAVGDALFQKRCYQKIEELVSRGVTLLFVSHDQETIRTLTDKAILLSNGRIVTYGASSEVLLDYRRMLHEQEKAYNESLMRSYVHKPKTPAALKEDPRSERLSFGDLDAEIIRVKIIGEDGGEKNVFYPGERLQVAVTCKTYRSIANLSVIVRIRNKEGVRIYSWGTLNQDITTWARGDEREAFWDKTFYAGQEFTVFFEAECDLGPNVYEVQAAVTKEKDRYYMDQRMLHWIDEAAFFAVHILPKEYIFTGVCDLRMRASWSTIDANRS